MKKALLPPLLPLLLALLVLLGVALFDRSETSIEGHTEPLRWVMFLPILMIWMYVALLVINLLDSLIQRDLLKGRWLSIGISGAVLSAFLCLIFLRLETLAQHAITILSAYVAAASMNFWRNQMKAQKVKVGDIKIRTGIYGLALIFLLAFINSGLFMRASGSGYPIMDIAPGGLVVNMIASVLAWILFVKGRRGAIVQSIVSILLMVLIHYMVISNVWSVLVW